MIDNEIKNGVIAVEEKCEIERYAEEDVVQVVSFSLLDGVEYGIDILHIHEILRMVEITRLPNTPDFVRGVINLRGNVIPVVNMRMRFGYTDTEKNDDTRIIVTGIEGRLVGLLVNKVYQVVRIPLKDINFPSQLVEGVSEEFIHGVGRSDSRLIILLNLEHMLFRTETEV